MLGVGQHNSPSTVNMNSEVLAKLKGDCRRYCIYSI